MSDFLTTLTILKTKFEDKGDFIDAYLPFIATIISRDRLEEITFKQMERKLKTRYSITFSSHHPIEIIFNRLVKLKIIKSKRNNNEKLYEVINTKINEKLSIETSSQTQARKINKLISEFIKYYNYEMEIEKELSEKKAENILISFIKKYDKEILLSTENEKLFILTEKVSKEDIYM